VGGRIFQVVDDLVNGVGKAGHLPRSNGVKKLRWS
jgi:hypothetical protein